LALSNNEDNYAGVLLTMKGFYNIGTRFLQAINFLGAGVLNTFYQFPKVPEKHARLTNIRVINISLT
jgi:hypothetical protein